MKNNTIKIINSGELPEYLIYEHGSKMLVFKIIENYMLDSNSKEGLMYSALASKTIDGRKAENEEL